MSRPRTSIPHEANWQFESDVQDPQHAEAFRCPSTGLAIRVSSPSRSTGSDDLWRPNSSLHACSLLNRGRPQHCRCPRLWASRPDTQNSIPINAGGRLTTTGRIGNAPAQRGSRLAPVFPRRRTADTALFVINNNPDEPVQPPPGPASPRGRCVYAISLGVISTDSESVALLAQFRVADRRTVLMDRTSPAISAISPEGRL
jgi:hypothetical protein